MEMIQQLGHNVIKQISGLGKALLMLISALFHVPNFRKGTPLLINQLYAVGVLSLVIITVLLVGLKKDERTMLIKVFFKIKQKVWQ